MRKDARGPTATDINSKEKEEKSMALDWLKRDNELKDHQLVGDEHFGTEAPCTVYEKKPLVNPQTGETVDGLYTAWITLNNPNQFNSYTTQMVKGVIAGMKKAGADRSVVAIVFTGAGDQAFCTGGNTKEYAEYYTKRPREYRDYINLFSGMVDAILDAGAPVICRVNGMRVAGGQEIGMACDIAIAADTASFGAGRHRSRFNPGRWVHGFPPLAAAHHRAGPVELRLQRALERLQDAPVGPGNRRGTD
jgi:6-oxocyclohex-1-ene-carbonyl-CoA hydrolase